MWVRFTRFAGHIFPDRTAFYYRAGTCYDLPEEWCAEWIAEMGGDGSAVKPSLGPAAAGLVAHSALDR